MPAVFSHRRAFPGFWGGKRPACGVGARGPGTLGAVSGQGVSIGGLIRRQAPSLCVASGSVGLFPARAARLLLRESSGSVASRAGSLSGFLAGRAS